MTLQRVRARRGSGGGPPPRGQAGGGAAGAMYRAAMSENSRGTVRVEPSAKRVRAYLGGRVVADTRRPSLVWEVPYYPAYYFPLSDVTAELSPTGEPHPSPSLGDGGIDDVQVDGAVAEGAGRPYPDTPLPAIRDLVR